MVKKSNGGGDGGGVVKEVLGVGMVVMMQRATQHLNVPGVTSGWGNRGH